jgi:hypothetical protein
MEHVLEITAPSVFTAEPPRCPSEDAINGHWRDEDRAYLPSKEEIAAACREIRREWSEAERERRWADAHPKRWTVPHAGSSGQREPHPEG